MAKHFMTSAKELAWKAYSDNEYGIKGFLVKEEVMERFENWWSNNFGNKYSTKFNPEHDVYVNGQRYIRAEADIQPTTIVPASSSMDCNTCTLAHCRTDCQGFKEDGLPRGFKFSPSGRVVLDNEVTPNVD